MIAAQQLLGHHIGIGSRLCTTCAGRAYAFRRAHQVRIAQLEHSQREASRLRSGAPSEGTKRIRHVTLQAVVDTSRREIQDACDAFLAEERVLFSRLEEDASVSQSDVLHLKVPCEVQNFEDGEGDPNAFLRTVRGVEKVLRESGFCFKDNDRAPLPPDEVLVEVLPLMFAKNFNSGAGLLSSIDVRATFERLEKKAVVITDRTGRVVCVMMKILPALAERAAVAEARIQKFMAANVPKYGYSSGVNGKTRYVVRQGFTRVPGHPEQDGAFSWEKDLTDEQQNELQPLFEEIAAMERYLDKLLAIAVPEVYKKCAEASRKAIGDHRIKFPVGLSCMSSAFTSVFLASGIHQDSSLHDNGDAYSMVTYPFVRHADRPIFSLYPLMANFANAGQCALLIPTFFFHSGGSTEMDTLFDRIVRAYYVSK